MLDIVGPIEDREYWKECEAAARTLPGNVKLNVLGPMPYPETLARMQAAHFFVLPTLTENFGYVFIEALACGCPLLISDRTVWNDVSEKGSGWAVPIEDPAAWNAAIRRCLEMGQDEYAKMAKAAREHAVDWLADPQIRKRRQPFSNGRLVTDAKRITSCKRTFVDRDRVVLSGRNFDRLLPDSYRDNTS